MRHGGKVCTDLIDATDLLSTFASIAGASLSADKVLDGRSILPQLRGEPGQPRGHIFVELARNWHVREANWKLNEANDLFDMSGAPFEERPIAANADTEASMAARARLTAALAKLNPAGGIVDEGDGSGRHADKLKKKGNAQPTPGPRPVETLTDAEKERAAKFDRLDKDKHGELTLEEYVSRQSDPEGAKKRFEKFDADNDGHVTRGEYSVIDAKKPEKKP